MRAVTFLLCLLCPLLFSAPTWAYKVVNGQIRNDQNQPVALHGVNWFGFETEITVAHGLWARNYKRVITQLRDAGINAVRLPLCPATIHGQAITQGINYKINVELEGLNSLQVLDALIAEMAEQGMLVLLDHHRPNCSTQAQLWYTPQYSETEWISDLSLLAQRYKNTPNVIGIDLKNEPHGAVTWGSGDKTTDWNQAAERASAAVLAIAPRWLMFVNGVGDVSQCKGQPGSFWGENLQPFRCSPLNIPASQLVLSPHVYGPDISAQPYFSAANFPRNMPALWDARFGFLALQGHAIVPGEFGGGYGHCASRDDRIWQDSLVDYFISRGMTNGFYWSLNPNSAQTGGLFMDDWQTLWPDKLAMLQRLYSGGKTRFAPADFSSNPTCNAARPASPIAPEPVLPPGTDKGERGSVVLSAQRVEALNCYVAKVSNTSGSPVVWQVKVPMASPPSMAKAVQFQPAVNGYALARGDGNNFSLAPSESTSFSYCTSAVPATAPTIAPVATGALPSHEGFVIASSTDSEWATGYCQRVKVTNAKGQQRAWLVPVALRGTLKDLWKAKGRIAPGRILLAQGQDFNRLLKPGESTDFGFCVNK